MGNDEMCDLGHAPSKCEVLLHDWTSVVPDLIMASAYLTTAKRVIYFDMCVEKW